MSGSLVTDSEPDIAKRIQVITDRASQFVWDCNSMKLDNNEMDAF